MKNLLNISALLCAAALITACSNEEIMENGTSTGDLTLTATTGANTKTSVNVDDYKVTWTAGDAFYAFGTYIDAKHAYDATAKFTLTSGKGTANAEFSGTLTGSKSDLLYAVYPTDAYSSSEKKVPFPTVYTYPNSNAPMFGKLSSDKTSVNFDQLLSGMMRIKLNGLKKDATGSLILTADGIEGSGTLSIDPSGNASLIDWHNGTEGTVTLNFTKTADTDPLVLDIPVPAATYANGITATLTIGGATAEVFKTTESFEVPIRTIKEMPTISDIKIEGTTDLTFSKLVESAEDAVKALNNGEKNITVNTMAVGDEIAIPNSAGNGPITINVNEVTGGDGSITIKGDNSTNNLSVSINVPEGVEGKLKVEDIDHVEINGTWTEVTASTGESTFVVKAGAVIKDLTVKQGNIEIEEGGVVNKLTLNNDVTINKSFDVSEGKSMEIDLGTYTLTLPSRPQGIMNYVRIFKNASLTIKGAASEKGTVNDGTKGISVYEDGATFTMENVDYVATNTNGYGVFLQDYVSSATINIKNSTMTGKYYCVGTNAATPVGSDNTISLESSTFTADETALLVNTPTKVTATGCTFTGGWQGAFLRSGETTFDACSINLNVKSSYEKNTVQVGATSWGNGNKAPSAALTAGNKNNNAYDRKTTVHFTTSCEFNVTTDDSGSYPTIYIDADTGKPNQGVIITYDNDCKTTIETKGVLDIRNTDGKVTVNGVAYSGAD